MSSTKPTESTIKTLFALSGNECAFTGCPTKLVQDRNNLIGEICHIEARRPKGARYNWQSNDEKRRSIENLIILCPTHHKIIDNDVDTYTVKLLKEMKSQHELRHNSSSFELSDRDLGRLMFNSGYYSVNVNWWRSTIIYNALSKFYLPKEIRACKDDCIRFEVFGENRKVVISTEVDVNGVHGSLYEIEKQLNGSMQVDYCDEFICFVFCKGLLDGRFSRKNNSLSNNFGIYPLNKVLQMYLDNYIFVPKHIVVQVSFPFIIYTFGK